MHALYFHILWNVLTFLDVNLPCTMHREYENNQTRNVSCTQSNKCLKQLQHVLKSHVSDKRYLHF